MRNWSAHSKFIFKISVRLQISEDYNVSFCRTNIWGEEVAYSCLQRGGELREMSTLSLCINPLESSSKEHLHVYTSRTDKGGWCLTERVARTCAAAEVSLFYSHFLSWERTLPGAPHQVTVNSELTRCDALLSALCAAASNALANASACNGGCQHHLDSIDQAPTRGQTIRSVFLIINPNDRLELGLQRRKDHAWSLWHCVLNMLANFKKSGSAIVSCGC